MIKRIKTFSGIFFLIILLSCEDNKVNIPEGAFDENTVNLSGAWIISQVMLNNVDITDRMDFSSLTLNLNMENNNPATFTLAGNTTPFIVTESGSWQYDDPSYPTRLRFISGLEPKEADFDAPPISNDDRFSIRFSLGCVDNIYVYHFIKQR